MASGGKPIPIVDEEESEEETVLSEEGEGKRLKTQTKKGMEQFLTFLKKYSSQEQKAWSMIEEILVDIDENIDQKNFKDLRKIKAELQQFKHTYFDCANDFLSFLKRTNTRESNEEFSIQEPRFCKRSDIIDQLMNRIEDALLDAADTISRASSSEGSRSQSRSSVSEMSKSRVLLRQKAEAEKAKLAFVRQQVDLQTEKSKIEGQIQILNQRCSAAIADAEAKVFEREESETKSERNSILDELPKDRGQRVADYVESVSRDQESSVRSHVNPKIVQPIPSTYNFDVPLTRPKEDSVETVTKFLLRKEVLLSRFSNFNDEPEAYNAWKLNFTSIIKDLQISEFEELQLLVRWLGPESSKHAADIQQANAGNPKRGLRQIWARLDERYGAIELIDDSLKSKLAAFPQLMIKDPKELYKLSDLLTQVDGVKKNPKYSAALSYYDTSLGIAPIVSKLPYQWREKWINRASEYKERHSVPYPPFTYFVKFIQDLCRVRNDPGFQFSEPTKKETKTKNTGQIRSRKTDVKPSKSTGQRKSCFLEHRVESNHNIKDCRKFRTLPIGSRKKLLKENGICFRCCDSKEHLARDCNVKLKCDMCQSDRHCGALHVNSSQGGEDKENSHGGENSISSFTTNCTQVCSPAFSGKSCAKIILVNIFPVGREDLKKRAYVILDDQSSRTLAKSSFFDKFGIKGQEISYTLSSCSGSAMVSGRQAFDLDHNQQDYSKYPLLDPDNDCEIRRTVTVVKTSVLHGLNSNVFTRFSTWDSLIRGLSFMRSVIRQKINLEKLSQTKLYQSMEKIVIKSVQFEAYGQDIERLKEHKPVTKGSPLQKLDPYLDNEGLLRVGGRILTGDVLAGSNGPIIVPKKSHVARLLIKHHHLKCKHQGRHLTEGAVRSAGYWVMGAKRLISSLLNSCVICRKLRRKLETQKMGNIPDFRCKPSPPFTYVGVDTFGPWEVTARKTRGGVANAKRWAILFTCLTSRAVHIELVDEMTSSAFINSLRRFVAMRGKVTEFYSDRGTNFVGSTDALNINAINIESPTLKKYMVENGSTWIFNPPHASHMGGIWERIIQTARRILNAIIMESKKPLTHDVLNTFMYEVCAIINSRPLANVSVDPTQPSVLSPSVLLTQKTEVDYGPFQAVDVKDMYRSSWKHTQLLANQFWKRWQQEYLYSLQTRQKWTYSKEDIKVDDVVLLKDSDTVRYEWPMAVVQRTFPSKDGHVRKVELRTVRNGTCITYVRPITEIVHLFTP